MYKRTPKGSNDPWFWLITQTSTWEYDWHQLHVRLRDSSCSKAHLTARASAEGRRCMQLVDGTSIYLRWMGIREDPSNACWRRIRFQAESMLPMMEIERSCWDGGDGIDRMTGCDWLSWTLSHSLAACSSLGKMSRGEEALLGEEVGYEHTKWPSKRYW